MAREVGAQVAGVTPSAWRGPTIMRLGNGGETTTPGMLLLSPICRVTSGVMVRRDPVPKRPGVRCWRITEYCFRWRRSREHCLFSLG
jgi:hypothetical protein